jgi:hypothetical protein
LKNPRGVSSKRLDRNNARGGRKHSEDNASECAKKFGRKTSNVFTPNDFTLFAVVSKRLL